ncbi:hypothetical protein SFC50_04385 [Bacillus infantis]|uniref:hypothetical protein n=1 Tax=Bacillus infantis TaxID=324767 RepID=UPI0039821EB6
MLHELVVENIKVEQLKKAFKEYLQVEYIYLKDKSVILSDAFYPYRYDIGMSLWAALESEQSMMNCRSLLETYFTNVHKVNNPNSNASTYMRSMKILKEFIDKAYGGVSEFIKLDVEKINKVTSETVNSSRATTSVRPSNVHVPRPSQDELEKYLHVWDTLENYSLQESALEKLFFRTYPKNTNIDDVLIKVSTLNDFYSTNIISPFQVAKHIVGLNIDDRLQVGDLTLVNEIAKVQVDNGSVKNFYSFATKYCSHHNPTEFPIYDSYVDKVLRYFREADNFKKFKNDDLKRYAEFKNILLQFRAFYKLNSYTMKDIDKYLWLLGKEKFPNKY